MVAALEPAIADLFRRHPYVVQPAVARLLYPNCDEAEQAKRAKILFRRLATRQDLLEGQKFRSGYYLYRLSPNGRQQLGLKPQPRWPSAAAIRQRLALLFFCSGGRRQRVLITPAELTTDFPELLVSPRTSDHHYFFEQRPDGTPFRLVQILVDTAQSAERLIDKCVSAVATRIEHAPFRGLIRDRRFALAIVTNLPAKKRALLAVLAREQASNPARFESVDITVFVETNYQRFYRE